MSQSLCQKRVRVVVEDANKRPYFRSKYMHGPDFESMRFELKQVREIQTRALDHVDQIMKDLNRHRDVFRLIGKFVGKLEQKMDDKMMDAPTMKEADLEAQVWEEESKLE